MPKKKVKKIVEGDEYGIIVELDLKPGQPIKSYFDESMIIPVTFPWEEPVYRATMEDYEFPPELAAKLPVSW